MKDAMKALDISLYSKVLREYLSQAKQFPLITSVLTQKQHGVIYWDGIHQNFFISHKFGFSQLLELESSTEFDKHFLIFFFINKNFCSKTVRWYDVNNNWLNKIEKIGGKDIIIIERIQLKYREIEHKITPYKDPRLSICLINNDNFDKIDSHFNLMLASRFWPSKQSFLKHSFGVVVFMLNEPISICYGCAVENQCVEIDIFTDPNYRNRSVGNLALRYFIDLCKKRKITPNWDCYKNNWASINLARKAGFVPNYVYSHVLVSR